MIFAWNNVDPITGNNDWLYHGIGNRSTQVTVLMSYKEQSIEEQETLPVDTFTFDIRMPNVIK